MSTQVKKFVEPFALPIYLGYFSLASVSVRTGVNILPNKWIRHPGRITDFFGYLGRITVGAKHRQ